MTFGQNNRPELISNEPKPPKPPERQNQRFKLLPLVVCGVIGAGALSVFFARTKVSDKVVWNTAMTAVDIEAPRQAAVTTDERRPLAVDLTPTPPPPTTATVTPPQEVVVAEPPTPPPVVEETTKQEIRELKGELSELKGLVKAFQRERETSPPASTVPAVRRPTPPVARAVRQRPAEDREPEEKGYWRTRNIYVSPPVYIP